MGKVTIEVYQNHNSKSESYGKYYGHAVQASTIDEKTLCKYVAMDSGVEESEVAVVYDGQLKQVRNCSAMVMPLRWRDSEPLRSASLLKVCLWQTFKSVIPISTPKLRIFAST